MVAEVSRPYGDCRGSPSLATARAPRRLIRSAARGRDDDGAILGGVARDLGGTHRRRPTVDPHRVRRPRRFQRPRRAALWRVMADPARPTAVAVRPAGGRRSCRDRRHLRRAARAKERATSTVRGPSCSCSPVSPSPSGSHAASPRPAPRSPSAVAPASTARSGTVREPRPPSALGRWALASALLVGAAGAIGYQLDGDGLHPERWLGAAAGVCGIGIVIGAWRGRALWLVVPGLLFAGSGFVAGHAARAGIDEFEAGTRHVWVDSARRVGLPDQEDLVAGEIEVTLFSAPLDDYAFGPAGRPRRHRHRRRRRRHHRRARPRATTVTSSSTGSNRPTTVTSRSSASALERPPKR